MFLRIRDLSVDKLYGDTKATIYHAFIFDFICCWDQIPFCEPWYMAFNNWYPVRIWRRWKMIVTRPPYYQGGADWFPDYL